MNTPSKFIACGTAALFAAALAVQAQTSASSQQTQPSTGSGSTAGSSSTASASTASANSAPASTAQSTTTDRQTMSPSTSSSSTDQASATNRTQPASSGTTASTTDTRSGALSGSAAGSASGSLSASGSTNTSRTDLSPRTVAPANSTSATANTNSATNQNSSSVAGSSSNLQSNVTTQNQFSTTTSTVSDAQVTTFVRQLDTQGPAVVHRVSTVVGDLACNENTLEQLVEALHSGKSVTITSEVNGQQKSATFNASGAHLGYGEAYIALALAAQQLRNAGITGCATPEQWQAVLLGGPLSVSGTTAVASSSTRFPGIVTLHSQGQGWGQIAQTANLQLGQVINSSASESPSPTGFSSAEMNQANDDKDSADKDNGKHKGQKKHWWSRNKDKDDKKEEEKSSNAATPSPQSEK